MANDISQGWRECPRCGNSQPAIWTVCDECGLEINEFHDMEDREADSLLLVGGRGVGPGANRGEVFHAIKENGDESVCERLEGNGGQCPRDGVQWTRNVLDLAATEDWQTRPCHFCDQKGGFDGYKSWGSNDE